MKNLAVRVFAALAFCVAAPALAQSPAPSPVPSPSPTPLRGFSASGTLGAQSAMMGSPASLLANVNVMNNGSRVRIDLLKFAITGGDPTINAMVTKAIPQGGLSIVFDQKTRVATIWSTAKKVYYESQRIEIAKSSATPKPKATPGSDVDSFLKFMKGMTQLDSFNATANLAGHKLVNGQMASVFDYDVKMQKHGDKPAHVAMQLALADGLSGIPIHFTLNAEGASMGANTISLAIDLQSISLEAPAASNFSVPAGFKKVKQITELIGPPTP